MRICKLAGVASWAAGFSAFFVIVAVANTSAELGHVAQVGHVRPVRRQHQTGVRIRLGKRHRSESGLLEADGKATDSAEQVKVCWPVVHVPTSHTPHPARGCPCPARASTRLSPTRTSSNAGTSGNARTSRTSRLAALCPASRPNPFWAWASASRGSSPTTSAGRRVRRTSRCCRPSSMAPNSGRWL